MPRKIPVPHDCTNCGRELKERKNGGRNERYCNNSGCYLCGRMVTPPRVTCKPSVPSRVCKSVRTRHKRPR